jgi:spore coat protein U-like protein
MKKFLLLTAIACTAAVSAVAPAMAGTSTGTITIGASTAALCTAPVTAPVALGNYDGTTAVGPIAASVVFRCTNTTKGTVTLTSASTGAINGGTLNTLVPNLTPITYSFTGDGLFATGTGLTAGNDISTPVTVSIAAGQNPIPATYADTINVTVTY